MKGNLFIRFLRNRDSFGHSVKLGYKGNDKYYSAIGGILTLFVQVLSLVMVIQAIDELYVMRDPLITNYAQPLTKEQRSQLIPMKFDDYGYVLAFKLTVVDQ